VHFHYHRKLKILSFLLFGFEGVRQKSGFMVYKKFKRKIKPKVAAVLHQCITISLGSFLGIIR